MKKEEQQYPPYNPNHGIFIVQTKEQYEQMQEALARPPLTLKECKRKARESWKEFKKQNPCFLERKLRIFWRVAKEYTRR